MSTFTHPQRRNRVKHTPPPKPKAKLDLRGLATPCDCGREAVCEKAGRTVCRQCADRLTGREFPLRTARQWSSRGAYVEREQMGMLERPRGMTRSIADG
jgi:hypothetical protein